VWCGGGAQLLIINCGVACGDEIISGVVVIDD
jgi:hypothetical protein